MTLVVETPGTRAAECDYILGVLLGEFVGLSWRRQAADSDDVRITLPGQPGEIRLPDVLLATPDIEWLNAASMPTQPLATWDTRYLAANILLTNPVVPVLFGDAGPAERINSQTIKLPIDLFGSAFFMLSRYEEAVLPDRDSHNRFPATVSLAYRAGFLDRPIVDEYVEILWAAMQRIWPGLDRKPRQPRMRVSCDVDSPFALTGAIKGMGRRFAGDLLKRHSPALARRNLAANWQARSGDHSRDPHRNGIDWIMDINERAGQSVGFYFIPENTDRRFDNRVSLDEPRMRALVAPDPCARPRDRNSPWVQHL